MNYNNLAQKTNFIASSDKFENVPFFLTSVNIPGISVANSEVGGKHSAPIKLSGDTITYSSLAFEMLIDEDFLIYQELMAIINKNVDINTGTFSDFYFDFFIELSNSKGNKVLKVDFSNCRIESIGDIFLDTTSEETQYTLSMDIAYDYYKIEQLRRFTFIGGEATPVNPIENPQLTYSEDFTAIPDGWVLWGYPTPVISYDSGSVNGQGLDSNGSGQFGSGTVYNDLAIDVTKPFDFTFRVKQPLGADTNENLYIDFGITEGIGIETTGNGRTGSTVMGVVVDGGNKDGAGSTKSMTYSFKGAIDDVKEDFANDGFYHEYRFVYTIDGQNAEYQIYMDGELQSSVVNGISSHDYFYLYMQGKSDSEIQILDTITGNYNEE